MRRPIFNFATLLVLTASLLTSPLFGQTATLGEYRGKYVGNRAIIMDCEGLHFAERTASGSWVSSDDKNHIPCSYIGTHGTVLSASLPTRALKAEPDRDESTYPFVAVALSNRGRNAYYRGSSENSRFDRL